MDNAPHRQRPTGFRVFAGPRPPEEAAPHVDGSDFSPQFLSFSLKRVDSSWHHLHLLHALEVCERLHELLCKDRGRSAFDLAEMSRGSAKRARRVEPRAAFLPLAWVGHPQADGRLLGMGVALHKKATKQECSAVLDRIRTGGIVLGKFGRWRFQPSAAGHPQENLRPETWTSHPRGASEWATVTPIASDRHSEMEGSAAYAREMEDMIRLACRRAAVPEPCKIIVTPVSTHFGVPPASAFPRFRKGGSQRRHCHAILIFAEPMCGPLLLGAGRYCGSGLCRPMLDEA